MGTSETSPTQDRGRLRVESIGLKVVSSSFRYFLGSSYTLLLLLADRERRALRSACFCQGGWRPMRHLAVSCLAALGFKGLLAAVGLPASSQAPACSRSMRVRMRALRRAARERVAK